MAVFSFFGVLGAFVLWVMVWRANLQSLAAKPWYVRHLSGLIRGGVACCIVIAVLMGLNWKSIKAQQQRTARAAELAPSAPPLKAVASAAAPTASPAAPPLPAPGVPLSDMLEPAPNPVALSALYRVKSDNVMATFKRTIAIELFKHESEATLAAICRDAKSLNPVVVDRTFVTFDVRGEPKPPQMSNWAIARFDPELSVSILGDN